MFFLPKLSLVRCVRILVVLLHILHISLVNLLRTLSTLSNIWLGEGDFVVGVCKLGFYYCV